MKKFWQSMFVLLFVPVLVLACAVPACADLVFDPGIQDPFYYTYRDRSYEENRYYTTAGADGSVEFWSEPNGEVLRNCPNGEHYLIRECKTEGDTQWGWVWFEDVWVRMEDMSLIYDHIEFMQDHSDEIEFLDHDTWLQADRVKYFTYPNGPEEGAIETELYDSMALNILYTDEAGLRWGYRAGSWVCIDEPLIKGAPEYVHVSDVKKETSPLSAYFPLILAAVLVVAVVIVTVVLIRKLPKRKGAAPKGEDDLS